MNTNWETLLLVSVIGLHFSDHKVIGIETNTWPNNMA